MKITRKTIGRITYEKQCEAIFTKQQIRELRSSPEHLQRQAYNEWKKMMVSIGFDLKTLDMLCSDEQAEGMAAAMTLPKLTWDES